MTKTVFLRSVMSICVLAMFGGTLRADEPVKAQKPRVEVVFCLDTTGSMGGLIEAAKKKIWSISNQIARGNPTPDLRVGLVAYRDRSDAKSSYVTKIYDLTDDLDAVYNNLMEFQAQGGGDTPESVNQALRESVTKIKWSEGDKVLKIIFLVGDAPPKIYKDDVKYQDTCQQAVKNNIIINTIQCGHDASTQQAWKDICRLAEGSFVQIDQKGGPVVVVKTPFDADLAKINTKLSKTTLTWGSKARQMKLEKLKEEVSSLSAPAAADRAAFYANSGRGASYDLLHCVNNGTIKLEDLKKEELPPELRKLSLKEQKAYLKKLSEQREELNKQAVELDKKRKAFIAKKTKEELKNLGKDSFDNRVLNILQNQATRINVRYEAVEEKKK